MTPNSIQPKILMYRATVAATSLVPEIREAGAALYDLSIKQFRFHMEYLKENKYNVITLGDDSRHYDEKDIVITFDDGEMNNYEQAFSILKEYGFKAYFFVTAKYVGKPGYMDLKELKELLSHGMVIGSHGLSNEVMTTLLDTQIEEELRASKDFLERNLGVEILDFSIPRSFVNDKIIRKAYEQGYERVFISHRPRILLEPCLNRIIIRRQWTLKRFEQGVSGHVPLFERVRESILSAAKFVLRENGYNWVRNTIIKIVK